jgi:hypothetical protein
MKQLPNIGKGDGPQAQNRAATIAAEILGIVQHELLAWWYRDHHANLAAARCAIEALLRAELEAAARKGVSHD